MIPCSRRLIPCDIRRKGVQSLVISLPSQADCGGACNVGSLGHYEQDAATYARWGMDFMKMDWCSSGLQNSGPEKMGSEGSRLAVSERGVWGFG